MLWSLAVVVSMVSGRSGEKRVAPKLLLSTDDGQSLGEGGREREKM